ncbi:hypothetical protein D3C73_491030 [compost metagenome]
MGQFGRELVERLICVARLAAGGLRDVSPFLQRVSADSDSSCAVCDVICHSQALKPQVQSAGSGKAQHGDQAGDSGNGRSDHATDRSSDPTRPIIGLTFSRDGEVLEVGL